MFQKIFDKLYLTHCKYKQAQTKAHLNLLLPFILFTKHIVQHLNSFLQKNQKPHQCQINTDRQWW